MKKREINIIALITLSVTAISFTQDFINEELINYAIVSGSIAIVLSILSIRYIIKTRSVKAIYDNFIKDNLKTYDAIMIETETLPELKGKNIVRVRKFSDIIDAQIEVKKPIYYKKFTDYTVFILLDNKEACVNIVKLNENIECAYEVSLDETIKNNLVKDLDKSLLNDIDKTTIIRLDNAKEFRVSPVRKEKSNEFTPKNYYIRKNNIFCTLSDDTEKRILIRDIIDLTKVFDSNNVLRHIKISTGESNFILKETSEMDMTTVEERLLNRISKINNGLKEKIEYQEN